MTAVKRSASNDDLQALAQVPRAPHPLELCCLTVPARVHSFCQILHSCCLAAPGRTDSMACTPVPPAPGQAAMQDEQDMVAAEQDFPDDESVATVHSMPAVSAARDLQRVRRSRRKGTSLDGDGDADQDLDSFSAVHSEKSGGSETESPAERLFGKTRARELRQRIARGRNVTPQAASEALDAATAAIMGSESSETIEFVTWFSVWLLLMFWLLFYSSYGPMLWRFLYGPMGLVLCLPFGFALLFWLMAYTFSAFND